MDQVGESGTAVTGVATVEEMSNTDKSEVQTWLGVAGTGRRE